MYPEAGGSSSFARRAFNEFWSFFAAWAQMLTYVVDDRHLGVLRARTTSAACSGSALRHSPGDIIAGAVVIVVLGVDQRPSASRSRPALNVVLAVVDFLTQLLLVLIGARARALAADARRQRPPRRRADLERTSSSRSRSACSPTRASRRSRTWPRRPRTRRRRSRSAINRVRIAVFAIYFTLPAVALSALPVTPDAERRATRRCSGLTEEQGGYAGDPILGVVKQIDLGPLQNAGRDLRRPARRDDPLPRHQRGHDRRLAARLLDGHPPPAARPAAPAAPASTARRGSGS